MKDAGLMYVCIAIVLITSTTFAIKYNNLKESYQKAEIEKLDYCEKYYETQDKLDDLQSDMQWQDSVISFLQTDNQILTDFLMEEEMKNEN